jgi:hypothetical protein
LPVDVISVMLDGPFGRPQPPSEGAQRAQLSHFLVSVMLDGPFGRPQPPSEGAQRAQLSHFLVSVMLDGPFRRPQPPSEGAQRAQFSHFLVVATKTLSFSCQAALPKNSVLRRFLIPHPATFVFCLKCLLGAMREHDEKWHAQLEKLESWQSWSERQAIAWFLAQWVGMISGKVMTKTKCDLMKRNAWKKQDSLGTMTVRTKIWHLQHKKLVKFEQESGHCMVPNKHKQDEPLGQWVAAQVPRSHEQDKCLWKWVSKQQKHRHNDAI